MRPQRSCTRAHGVPSRSATLGRGAAPSSSASDSRATAGRWGTIAVTGTAGPSAELSSSQRSGRSSGTGGAGDATATGAGAVGSAAPADALLASRRHPASVPPSRQTLHHRSARWITGALYRGSRVAVAEEGTERAHAWHDPFSCRRRVRRATEEPCSRGSVRARLVGIVPGALALRPTRAHHELLDDSHVDSNEHDATARPRPD